MLFIFLIEEFKPARFLLLSNGGGVGLRFRVLGKTDFPAYEVWAFTVVGGQLYYPAVSGWGSVRTCSHLHLSSPDVRVLRDNFHLRGGLIFVITKIWSQDGRQTIKSCAGVIIIGITVAAAMVIIRLIGERKLQRFLNRILKFKRKPPAENLTADSFLPDNQT
jgi:hypothetical protein